MVELRYIWVKNHENHRSENTILKNGIIIDPFNKTRINGDLWIKNGKIENFGKFDFPPSAKIIDCSDKIVTHGF